MFDFYKYIVILKKGVRITTDSLNFDNIDQKLVIFHKI